MCFSAYSILRCTFLLSVEEKFSHTSLTKRMEDGGWRLEVGGWSMEDGGWKMEDGGRGWKMVDGG